MRKLPLCVNSIVTRKKYTKSHNAHPSRGAIQSRSVHYAYPSKTFTEYENQIKISINKLMRKTPN